MQPRSISKVFKSVPTIEGAGVHLKRAFGYHQLPLFDPFLMLDDFHTSNPDEYLAGFPWHPHRGIETITYILEGRVEHGDSMGNSGVIGAGDVQWMTAGSGVIHQEMPKLSPSGTMWGFQFWTNLPASQKMIAPRYRDVPAATIPEVTLEHGASIKVIAGKVAGVQGPVQDILADPELLDIRLPPGAIFEHAVTDGYTVVAYLLSGQGYFDQGRDPYAYDYAGTGWLDLERDCCFGPETTILYEHQGEGIRVVAGEQGVRFLLLVGQPLGEPIAWQGPIVMNSREELRIAFEEYHNGNFVK
ncbi:pirin family protein [Trichlorobacter lovleyi]|uniref:pirin family protein n=1 Tax=Trichlorobacter lovleyi TaxID=313985 RepID=UPI00224064FC|nr:pirin family protein [Trichlorobacter lovleyi]QOX77488.1 pirin family protein [Trichlorobacter lovleyi]